jgi:hypothetical protein
MTSLLIVITTKHMLREDHCKHRMLLKREEITLIWLLLGFFDFAE